MLAVFRLSISIVQLQERRSSLYIFTAKRGDEGDCDEDDDRDEFLKSCVTTSSRQASSQVSFHTKNEALVRLASLTVSKPSDYRVAIHHLD